MNELIGLLSNGFCWVILTFPDSSQRVIRTTVNLKLFLKEGVAPGQSTTLYDFDNKEYINFKGCKLQGFPLQEETKVVNGKLTTIYKGKPKLEGVNGLVEDYLK